MNNCPFCHHKLSYALRGLSKYLECRKDASHIFSFNTNNEYYYLEYFVPTQPTDKQDLVYISKIDNKYTWNCYYGDNINAFSINLPPFQPEEMYQISQKILKLNAYW